MDFEIIQLHCESCGERFDFETISEGRPKTVFCPACGEGVTPPRGPITKRDLSVPASSEVGEELMGDLKQKVKGALGALGAEMASGIDTLGPHVQRRVEEASYRPDALAAERRRRPLMPVPRYDPEDLKKEQREQALRNTRLGRKVGGFPKRSKSSPLHRMPAYEEEYGSQELEAEEAERDALEYRADRRETPRALTPVKSQVMGIRAPGQGRKVRLDSKTPKKRTSAREKKPRKATSSQQKKQRRSVEQEKKQRRSVEQEKKQRRSVEQEKKQRRGVEQEKRDLASGAKKKSRSAARIEERVRSSASSKEKSRNGASKPAKKSRKASLTPLGYGEREKRQRPEVEIVERKPRPRRERKEKLSSAWATLKEVAGAEEPFLFEGAEPPEEPSLDDSLVEAQAPEDIEPEEARSREEDETLAQSARDEELAEEDIVPPAPPAEEPPARTPAPSASASEPEEEESETPTRVVRSNVVLKKDRIEYTPRSKTQIALITLAALVAGAAVVLILFPDILKKKAQDSASPAQAEAPEVTETLLSPAAPTVHHAYDVALSRAQVATPFLAPEVLVGALAKEARAAVAAGDQDKAFRLLEGVDANLLDNEDAAFFAALLLEAQRFPEARSFLWHARKIAPYDPVLTQLLGRSFDESPRFLPGTTTLTKQDLSAIKYLGGGSTITLRFIKNGEVVAAFKPLQTRRQSNYRSEIAAWRLCELVRCSFKVPYNRPVRISEADFNDLYAKINSGRQRAYRNNFTDLKWRSGYLYGTEKEWIKEFTQFPIEVTSVWSEWLEQKTPMEDLDVPLIRALSPWRADPVTEKAFQRVLGTSGELTTRELAHQISDLLVFDYLVGNWDRFSGVKDWWGTNCQFGEGQFVSIDNGASFPSLSHAKVVTNRFEHVERFSHTMIQELRLLDYDQTLARLFPDPSSREEKAFARFWKKRAAVLARVDGLIETYGADAVLVFD